MGTALAAETAEFDTALDFDALVSRHQSMVFGLAYHFLQDRCVAEELAQDVFLQLYRHLDTLESPDHVTFWLRRVTCHRCIDHRRRRRIKIVSLDDVSEPAQTSSATDLLLEQRLRALVLELPDHARIAVVLRYQEDMSPDEIAKVLNRPVATIKSQLQRALKTLREKIGRVIGDRSR